MLASKPSRKYTYQDYLTWSDDERWEVIDGVAYNMTPAPSTKHQSIVLNFAGLLKSKLRKCKTFLAPTDVIFSDINVVQPDVFVVCDKDKITDKNIKGAPDLIIEVLSPSTSYKDRNAKRHLYENYGVKEYIIVYPDLENVERHILKNGEYGKSEIYNWDEVLKFHLFDIEINLWEIFDKDKPDENE